MARPRAQTLTELEGAALSVIRTLGCCTPYQVRQDFLASRSREWSGSAGAVYPALRRMHTAGLLRALETHDARGTVRYSLSNAGIRAFEAWLKNVDRAIGSGLDPFRCRADHWCLLPLAVRKALFEALALELEEKVQKMVEASQGKEVPERQGLSLELELHKTRLRWLKLMMN
jgi:DNA-binding PadR family transcriptional regulator